MKFKLVVNIIFLVNLLHLDNSNIYASGASEQLSLAKKAYLGNQFDKAIKYTEYALKMRPAYAEAYVLKGKCNIELDNYNLALDDFNQAANINPQESEYLYYRGMCEWKLKRVSASIQSLEKSLMYDPDNFLAYEVLGSLYFDLDMIQMAKINFDKAIDIQPDFSVNFFNKNKMNSYGEYYKIALRAINREVKEKPEDFKPYFYKGILKAIAGDNWGAYMELNNSVKLKPDISIMYYYKAYLEYNIKKFDLALSDLNRYYKKFPSDESVNSLITTIKEIQNIKIIVDDDDGGIVITFAEQMPEFNGGTQAMYKFLNENIKYPLLAVTENIEGKVVLSFIVDSKGYVGNIEVIKSIGGGCEEEAIRVVNAMPKWIPGKQNGKLVSVKYTLPVSFTISGDQ